jgi:hypothetical protein
VSAACRPRSVHRLLLLFVAFALLTATLTAAATAPAQARNVAGKKTVKKASAKKAKKAKKAAKKVVKKKSAKKRVAAPGTSTVGASVPAVCASAASKRGKVASRTKNQRTAAARKKAKARAKARAACAAPATTRSNASSGSLAASGTIGATTTASAASPAPGGLAVGLNVNANAWGADAGFVLDKAAFLGQRWIREEVSWSDVEPQRGQWNWSRYDQLFTASAQRGLQVLPLLTSPPSWAGPRWNSFPDDPADYGRFVAAVVARYGSNGAFWAAHPELPKVPAQWFELWNEPYEEYFSVPSIDPARYAQLVRAGTTAGRAADPSAKFMLESTPYGKGLPTTWTDALYAAMPDLNSYFDAVAVHAYGSDLASAGGQWRRTIEGVRAQLVAHGAADKPMWVTEMGWSTCPGANSDCTSESTQAARLAQALAALKTTYSSYVRGVMLYHFQDQFGDKKADDTQPYYGLVRDDFSPKPAATVVQQFTATLR